LQNAPTCTGVGQRLSGYSSGSSTTLGSAGTCVQDCVAGWSACNGTCGTDKFKTWTVTTPAGPGGTCSPAPSPNTLSCGDLGVCGRDCVGSWVTSPSTDADGWSACPPCGSGTQTRTWQNTTSQIPPGLACLHGDGYQETRACTNLPACVVPVPCQGSWSDWGACSISCGTGGTQTKTYTITQNSSNGGAACMDGTTNLETNVDARVKTRTCDPAPSLCCTDVSDQVGPWVDSPACTVTNGITYKNQSRALKTGVAATTTDVARCGFELLELWRPHVIVETRNPRTERVRMEPSMRLRVIRRDSVRKEPTLQIPRAVCARTERSTRTHRFTRANITPDTTNPSGTCTYGSFQAGSIPHCPKAAPDTVNASSGTCAYGTFDPNSGVQHQRAQ
jgi:hypothetical protein